MSAMSIATEFVNAETEDEQAAVIERHSTGLVRKGLRHWALKLERAAERSTGEEAATFERAAEQAWAAREALTDLIRADEPVQIMLDPRFEAALGCETLWPLRDAGEDRMTSLKNANPEGHR